MTTIDLTLANWQDVVLSSKIPVIVDFWAPWCTWCMKLMPIFEETSREYDGKLVFGKVNVEEQDDMAQKNGVMGIPVLKMFCNGRNVGELVGYMTREKLVAELDKMLATISDCLTYSSTLQKEVITK